MGLTRLAIHRPLTVLMAILALVLMGGVAYTYLHVDRLPPVTIGVVSVSSSLPNASAENVELLVTEPIENAVSGISGVDTITSTSSEGSASVIVQLADGYDPNQADLDIQQAMGPVVRQLPTNATAPVVRKFDPNASPVLNIAFTGAPLDQLYDIASNQIQPDLESVPGVGQVGISGGLQREIEVQVDYGKLAAYGVTMAQLSTALTNANVAVPSGSVPVGTEIINVVPQGLFTSVSGHPERADQRRRDQRADHRRRRRHRRPDLQDAVHPAAPERPGRRRPQHHAQLRRQHRPGRRTPSRPSSSTSSRCCQPGPAPPSSTTSPSSPAPRSTRFSATWRSSVILVAVVILRLPARLEAHDHRPVRHSDQPDQHLPGHVPAGLHASTP